MIFTIGHTASYEWEIGLQGEGFQKLGKCDFDGEPYGGGSVWATVEEAKAYLELGHLTEYSVYGVLADFDADTVQLPGEAYRRLLRDAQIVRLPVEVTR